MGIWLCEMMSPPICHRETSVRKSWRSIIKKWILGKQPKRNKNGF
ncbi:hypothetical protein [Helicobacter canis]|nr:hypothetical protein [Helicobacter canis]